MTEPPEPDWALIRHRYEETQDAVADICADAGITKSQLESHRRKEHWHRKHPRPFPPPRKPVPVWPAPEPTQRFPPVAGDEAADPSPEPMSAGVEDTTQTELPLPSRLATSTAHRRLLDRLVAAISMKLEQLERRMTTDLAAGEASSATDHERETRAIGALIDNLEKITEMETGLANTGGKRGAAAASAATTDLADEADRCRRELAERLHRIVEAAEKGA
jgi:hypothetical protein